MEEGPRIANAMTEAPTCPAWLTHQVKWVRLYLISLGTNASQVQKAKGSTAWCRIKNKQQTRKQTRKQALCPAQTANHEQSQTVATK